MKRLVVKKKVGNVRQANAVSSLYNSTLSITYGTVESNNTDSTCNIMTVKGFVLENIRLLSTVFPSKDPTIGGVKYPPLNAQVMIIHPTNDINSGFIIPAGLDFRDDTVTSDLLDQGDKTIFQGGWEKTYDPELGIYVLTNGTFELSLDPDGETVSLIDFKGNTFKNNDTVWEINGNANFAVRFGAMETAYNQLKTDFDNLVTLYNAHIHITTATITPGVPGVISPTTSTGSASTGDISGAKVDNIKVS